MNSRLPKCSWQIWATCHFEKPRAILGCPVSPPTRLYSKKKTKLSFKRLLTTSTISHRLTLRLPRWVCLPSRLSSSTTTRLKERRESTINPLIFRTTSKSSETTTSIRSFSTEATLTSTPTAAAQPLEDSDFIASLHAFEDKYPRLFSSSSITAPADPSIEIRRWKVSTFKYYDVPSLLPTLARGLFTREIPNDSKEGGQASTYQIVARGYDKFFGIGEVPWATVYFFLYSLLSPIRY